MQVNLMLFFLEKRQWAFIRARAFTFIRINMVFRITTSMKRNGTISAETHEGQNHQLVLTMIGLYWFPFQKSCRKNPQGPVVQNQRRC